MLPKSLSPSKFLFLKISAIAILSVIVATFILIPETSANDQADKKAAEPTNGQTVQSWQVIMDKSRLGFKAKYGGTEFDGRFKKFTAEILFDPETPETGSFDVDIDVTSVTTFNAERDYTIGDQDWFYFSKYSLSKYLTTSIKAIGENQFVALGTLDLKGRQKDVELRFSWNEYPNGDVKVEGQARMLAEADINRVDFGIGAGSWEKDDTVGFEILVKINLLLKK